MTIDSTWLHAFKEELPHAFTKSNPFHHSAVFIDGQIRLMQSPPKEPQTWDQFIFRQYARHVGAFLDRCDTVVLAFDNYEHVPLAKCMTQVNPRCSIKCAHHKASHPRAGPAPQACARHIVRRVVRAPVHGPRGSAVDSQHRESHV